MAGGDVERRVRIGIVGAGTNTRQTHLPALRKIPGVEIVVVCNRSDASSERVAKAFQIPRIARHWRQVVSAEDVDAVVIGTWPSLHADITIAALEHQKHVLTEARMAGTFEAAKRMWVAARRHPDLVAQIVPAPMSLDVDQLVQQLVEAGGLGELREVVVTHTAGHYADGSAALTWRQDAARSGINALSLGIVYEIVQRWVRQEVRWVVADAEIFTKSRPARARGTMNAVGLPESLSVLGRYPSGARFLCHLSGVEAGAGRGEIRLNGSKACLRFDFESGTLARANVSDQAQTPVEVPDRLKRGWRVEEDFIHSVRTNAPVCLTGFDQGLRYMAFVDAVWTSWKRGARKTVVDPDRLRAPATRLGRRRSPS